MGLITDGNRHAILSDILGMADHLGDMDFKVAGSEEGITAIQLDLKVPGLSMDVLSNALEEANKGRLHILDEMNKAIDKPSAISQYAPQIESFMIDKDKIGALIGPGGKNIKAKHIPGKYLNSKTSLKSLFKNLEILPSLISFIWYIKKIFNFFII